MVHLQPLEKRADALDVDLIEVRSMVYGLFDAGNHPHG